MLDLNLFVNFIIIFMIENVTQYVLGVCIEFIINDSEYNKEVLEHFIDKLNKLNDSIKAKVDDLACFHSSTGGRHGA